MTKDMKKRFIKFIDENELLQKGDKVVVGLSGGPDSVCLLHMLCSVRDIYNLEIVAAHINHMLRGKEADEDENYARKISNSLGVEFFCKREDINRYGKEKGLSSETAGREVRYNFFNEVKRNCSFSKIATAHNANDQAETVLMRIMRGTGLEGLGGIPVKRDGIYIRPILFMNRKEVEEYCDEMNLQPRIDESNLERVYSRNKVRLDILPYMKENFNPDVIETINRMAIILQEDNNFIQREVEKAFKIYCEKIDDSIKIGKELFNNDKVIISRVIRKAISDVSGSKYDVEMKHTQEVIILSELGTNKKVDLPNKIIAQNIYGDIYIKRREEVKINSNKELFIDKENILGEKIEFGKYIIRFEKLSNEKNIKFTNNNLIKCFNFDKINGNIIIRYRKNGDKIVPLGMSGNKKIKDIFIDMKIPQEERNNIPILQFDNDIAWVVGVRVSEKYKVTKDTINILKVIIERKEF